VLPTFLMIGPPRSATTSLHYLLAQHPEVCMSLTKEPNFFLFDHSGPRPRPLVADDRRIVAKSVTDRADYERLFPDPTASAVGEVSPLYLYTRETPRLIAELLPDAKLIAILREPVERAFSHFTYVDDGVAEDATEAFAAYVARELPLDDEPYRPGTHYLRLGRYAAQLQRYLDVFPRDQVYVGTYADLVGRPEETMREICRFLGVDDGFGFDVATRYNASTATGRVRRSLDRFVKPARPYLKRALPPRLAGAAARRRAEGRARHHGAPTAVPAQLGELLGDYYAADYSWLQAELGVTFG
jgi:hypothetical protein